MPRHHPHADIDAIIDYDAGECERDMPALAPRRMPSVHAHAAELPFSFFALCCTPARRPSVKER